MTNQTKTEKKQMPAQERRIEQWEDGKIVVIDGNGNFVGRFYSMPEAQRCVAALELLEAAREVVNWANQDGVVDAANMGQLRAAIQKAEGR